MRRLGPLLVALAVAAVAAAGCARTAPEAVGPEAVGPEAVAAPPNVVVVLADDLGFSDLGLMGSGIATPVLDSLARTGLLFPQAYNGAKCSPSRAMLMTGRSAHAAGMGDAIAGLGRERPAGPYQGYLDPAVPTLAERLAEAGYRSYLSGKWHLGEERPRWPIERGFDRTFGLISGASSYYTLRTDQRRVRQMTLDGAPFAPPASGFYMTHAFADTAVAFLREHAAEHADRPFALYLAFTAPHWPLHAPEATVQKYAGRYDDGWDAERARRTAALTEAGLVPEGAPLPGRPASVPAWADRSDADRTDADWPRRMEVHAAMVDEMDAALGRVLAQVRAMGVAENTLVLFTSDNGPSAEDVTERGLDWPGTRIGEPGSYAAFREPWAYAANAPLRRYKLELEEGGIRAPLVAHWPAGIARSGRVDATPVHLVDVLPTLLAASGLEGDLDGVSLLPAFRGDALPARTLYWEYQNRAAVRDGDWKALYDPEADAWALYDLAADPFETRDLATSEPARLAGLTARWLAWADGQGVFDHPRRAVQRPGS